MRPAAPFARRPPHRRPGPLAGRAASAAAPFGERCGRPLGADRHAARRPGAERPGTGSRLLMLAVALALALLTLGVGPAHGQVVPTLGENYPFGPFGTIVAPHGAGVITTDASTGAEQVLPITPPVGVAGHAAWSPDRLRLAVSRFGRRPGERVGGSDILVAPAWGGEGVPVVEHHADGALLGAPAWVPDSSGLFYDMLPPSGGPALAQVMFSEIGTNAAPRVVAQGGWPAVSPDGLLLAYVRPSPTSGFLSELVLSDLAGVWSRVLVRGDELVQITSPRFSPDGTEIAFIGSVTVGEARAVPGLGELFAKGVMRHGPPGDVWVMRVAGGPATRLTSFDEDEPTLAWSPDGFWLAMMGGGGLYLLPRDQSQPPYPLARGGFGGIDWR